MANKRLHHLDCSAAGAVSDAAPVSQLTAINFSTATVDELRRFLPVDAAVPAIMRHETAEDMRQLIRFLWDLDGAY